MESWGRNRNVIRQKYLSLHFKSQSQLFGNPIDCTSNPLSGMVGGIKGRFRPTEISHLTCFHWALYKLHLKGIIPVWVSKKKMATFFTEGQSSFRSIFGFLLLLCFSLWAVYTERQRQRYSQSCRPHGSWPFHDFDWYCSWKTVKQWIGEQCLRVVPTGRIFLLFCREQLVTKEPATLWIGL